MEIYTNERAKFFDSRMNILALDLGTQTGWALSQSFETISGSVSFSTNRLAGYGVRFLNFHNWLSEMLEKYAIDLVVFEDVRNHIGVYAARVYGGFLAQLTAICEDLGLDYQGYGVKTIKKFIAGNGSANKQMVIEAVQNQGFNPIDDNEADAIALLLLTQSDYDPQVSCRKDYTITDKTLIKPNKTKSNRNYRQDGEPSGHKVKNHKAKNNQKYYEILAGPFKVFRSTGEISAPSRYHQSFIDS